MVRFSGLDRFYSAMATEYDAVVERGQYRVPNRVTELLSDAKDRSFRVLDLGCANGHLGRVLASRGFRWKFFGVDFNDEMVWKCRESEVYESVLRCDLNEGVPVLEDEYFDIVLGAGITEFVESGEHFVADVARVLNRGGKALLTFEETAPDSLPWGEIQANGVVKFHYPEERILELFKRSGLAVESLERFDAYFSPTLRRWIPYVVVLARKP